MHCAGKLVDLRPLCGRDMASRRIVKQTKVKRCRPHVSERTIGLVAAVAPTVYVRVDPNSVGEKAGRNLVQAFQSASVGTRLRKACSILRSGR